MPVCACGRCGYVQQGLKSSERFYELFYSTIYSIQQERSNKNKELEMVKDNKKTEDGVDNIKVRAQNLHDYLTKYFPEMRNKKSKSLLDIGCGNGGFMHIFQRHGWNVFGNDPDPTACRAAKEYLQLDIDCIPAENMILEQKVDLIIIIGSLEHCFDPKKVLEKCHEYLNTGGLIVVDGRYFPIGRTTSYLNFNHQRFLRSKQLQILLISMGFDPIISTTYPGCGKNVVDGEGWCIARKGIRNDDLDIEEAAHELDLYESPNDLIKLLNKHDEDNGYSIEFSLEVM